MVRGQKQKKHYRDLFDEPSSRLRPSSSSSAPGSSSGPEVVPDSQGVSQPAAFHAPPAPPMAPPPPPVFHAPAAPPQAHAHDEAPPPPPAAGPVHPDLEVPAYAPYARYTLEDIIAMPGRDDLPVLEPSRSVPNSFWFDLDPCVGRSVADTMKGYFSMAHPNWKKTPNHVRRTWFKCFAQKWRWSLGITERVKKAFIKKAKQRLLDTVGNWKDAWIKDGYEDGKPAEITWEVWDGLIAYWMEPNSIRIAANCSASRNTRDEHGNLPMLHSTGQRGHAGIRLDMAKENGGVLPSYTELYERTHKNKAGEFVDPRSEQIYNEVVARVEERKTQLSQQNPDGGPVTLSTLEVDQIYEQVVPRKKGRILGIGSCNDVPQATSSYAQQRVDETTQLRNDLTTALHQMSSLEDILDVMAAGNPHAERMLAARRANLGIPPRQQQQPTAEEEAEADQRARDFFPEFP